MKQSEAVRSKTRKTRDNQTDSKVQEDGKDAFGIFGLKRSVLRGIKEAGFSDPSPIQTATIPIILEGNDLIAQAQTGTGKTAAFALPIINNLQKTGSIEVLIITPTRELAVQISEEIFKLGRFANVKTISFYGGQPIKRQMNLLEKKPQIAIATPGRLLDHLRNERLPNFCPLTVVLDESDEMLDMGFLDDIEEIFKYLPSNRQTLLFSATMPKPIQELAQKILHSPKFIQITPEEITNSDIVQRYYLINEHERKEAIIRLIDTESPQKAIIFVRMKKEADILSECLKNSGYNAGALHGDMDQRDRISTVRAFKDGSLDILVATDIAARGLDIRGISHVFNYHIPLNPESYVHRIGRTGRAGKKGVAITLATPLEFKEIRRIKDSTNSSIELYEIPAIREDLAKNEVDFLTQILATEITDEALGVYEQIKENIDMTQLCCKMISLLLQQKKVTKTNKIGLSKQEVLELQQKLDKNPYDKKNSSKGARRGHSTKQNSQKSSKGSKSGHQKSFSQKTSHNKKNIRNKSSKSNFSKA